MRVCFSASKSQRRVKMCIAYKHDLCESWPTFCSHWTAVNMCQSWTMCHLHVVLSVRIICLQILQLSEHPFVSAWMENPPANSYDNQLIFFLNKNTKNSCSVLNWKVYPALQSVCQQTGCFTFSIIATTVNFVNENYFSVNQIQKQFFKIERKLGSNQQLSQISHDLCSTHSCDAEIIRSQTSQVKAQ